MRDVRRGRAGRRGAARAPALQSRARRPLGDDEHHDRRRPAPPARRGGARPPPHADGDPLHHGRRRRLHRRRRRARLHGARRPRPDAELGLARPRQRDRQAGGLDGRPRHPPRPGPERDVLPDLRRAPGAADQARQRLVAAPRPRQPEPDLGEGAAAVLAAAPLRLGDDVAGRCTRCATPTATRTTASRSSTRTRRPAARCCRRWRAGSRCSAPASASRAHRHTGSAVYYVVEGAGETIIDGCRFVVGQGRHHRAARRGRCTSTPTSRGSDAAVLFSIQDRPVLEALGLYREEALADNGGHQVVTSTFPAQRARRGRAGREEHVREWPSQRRNVTWQRSSASASRTIRPLGGRDEDMARHPEAHPQGSRASRVERRPAGWPRPMRRAVRRGQGPGRGAAPSRGPACRASGRRAACSTTSRPTSW